MSEAHKSALELAALNGSGAVSSETGMDVAGTAAIPSAFNPPLVERHAGEEEGGLEDECGNNAHRGVDAEGLQGRQNREASDAKGNHIRS